MAKIDFTSNEVWRRLPLMGSSVAFFELWLGGNIGIAAGEPGEIALGVADHLIGEISAINMIAHKRCFLENDAGTTEWVEQAAFFGATRGEINENLS